MLQKQADCETEEAERVRADEREADERDEDVENDHRRASFASRAARCSAATRISS
jgi:hypothetical protein